MVLESNFKKIKYSIEKNRRSSNKGINLTFIEKCVKSGRALFDIQ